MTRRSTLFALATSALLLGAPIAARAGWGYYHLCIVDGTPAGAGEAARRSLELFKVDIKKVIVADEPTVVDVASADKVASIFEPGCAGTVRDAAALQRMILDARDRPYDGVIFFCYDAEHTRIWLSLFDARGTQLTHLFVPTHTATPLMGAGDMRGLVERHKRQALLKFLAAILPYIV